MEENKPMTEQDFLNALNKASAENRAATEARIQKEISNELDKRDNSRKPVVTMAELGITACAFLAFNAVFILLALNHYLDARVAWAFGLVSIGILNLKFGLYIGQRIGNGK